MKKTILLLLGLCISLLMQAKSIQTNNAISFDGIDDIVTAPLATTATDNITMEAWVNWNGATGKSQFIILNGDSRYSGYALYLNKDNDNKINVLCGDITIMSTEYHLTQNTWQHLAVVRDNGTWSLFLDGNPIALTPNSNNTTPHTPVGYFYIGGSQEPNEYFNGSIDEVRIWDVARTQTQIISAKSSPIVDPSNVANLVAYYDFNTAVAGSDNAGITTVTDLSASVHNGILNNSDLTGTTSNWIEGVNIVTLSKNTVSLQASNGSNDVVTLGAFSSWTASSDQTWLSVSPANGTYSGTLTMTAEANKTIAARTAIVTVSVAGVPSQTINVTQETENNALSLDGSNDYINLGTLNPTDNFSKGFSFMCWVKFNSFDEWARIFDFSNGESSDNLIAGVHTNGSLSFDIFSGSKENLLTTQAILKTGIWTHIAVTVDASGLQTIYVNGVNVASVSGVSPVDISRSICYLGKSAWNSDPYLNGQMDEVSIWNKTLSSTDIQNFLTTNVKGNESELYRYFTFDEGIANNDNTGITSLVDASTIQVNGTLNNFALSGTTSNWVAGYDPSVLSQTISLSATTENFHSSTTNSASVNIGTLASWTATSNDSWLHVSPSMGTSFGTITLTADEYSKGPSRTSTVTITASGLPSYTITVTQEVATTYTIASKAGTFYTKMSTDAKQNCTKLIVTDTIDARDFVTFRDSMPNLDTLDLSAAKIVAYSGDKGTGQHVTSYSYNENAIPMAAFYNFDISQASLNLKTIVLPNTSTEISGYAFNNCSNLSAITMPASLISIGEGVFINCTSLTAITIPASVTTMSQYVFVGSGLHTITFEDKSKLTSISYEAFYNCANLSAIRIPASVTAIVGNAFLGCNSLSSFTFEANPKLTSIEAHLFYNIPVSAITIPTSVTSIDTKAFESCSTLQFINAMSFNPIDLSSSSDVFNGVDKASCILNVPYGSKALYQAADQWKDFNNITEALILSDTKDAFAPVIDKLTSQIMTNGHDQYLKFIPTTSGTYTFSSASSSDPVGVLFDKDNNELAYNDDDFGNLQFIFSSDLIAGETYYISLYNCNGNNNIITLNISGGDLLSCKYTGIGTWDDVANWNIGSIPSIYNNVTIDGDVTINHDLSISNITISPNASMSIDNGVTIKYINLTLVNDETGSASLISDNTKMPATVSKYLKAGHNSYISSPMTTSKSDVVKVLGTDKLWNYDEKASSWNEITDGTTTLDSTSGYIANTTNDGNIYFREGVLNTGNYSNRLSNSGLNSKSGFNLVGNPYPSYLNWDLVHIANIDSSIWYRKQKTNNDYVFDTYNSKTGVGTNNYGGPDVTGIIPPMQAFWVHVKSSPDGILALDNSMRCTQDINYLLKADVKSNDIIRLQVANGENTDEAIIVFNSKASNAYDAWDSQKMFNESVAVPQIYTIADAEKVVINGLESVTTNSIIPLGFKTAKAGTFTISATEINGVDVVVLEDKLLNKTQDLTGSASYTFTSDNIDNASRFAIRLKANSVTDVTDVVKSTIAIAAQNQSIVVTTSETSGTINVYDLLGRVVETKAIEGTKTILESSAGVYFVKVQTATNTETTKIIIE